MDYEEDADQFMVSKGSPNVRITTGYRGYSPRRSGPGTGTAAGTGRRGGGGGGGEQDDESAAPQYAPQTRRAPDPFFKLVPSSASSQASQAPSAQPVPQEQQQQPQVRRPPPPTAANTSSASVTGHSSGAGGGVKFNTKFLSAGAAAKHIDWKDEMKRFYMAIGMPEKIAGIPTILNTWAGKEEQMLASLMDKYQKSIPPQMNAHLELLLSHMETHTESSFVKVSSSSKAVGSPVPPRSPAGSGRGANSGGRSNKSPLRL
jgi:hypothetical protein